MKRNITLCCAVAAFFSPGAADCGARCPTSADLSGTGLVVRFSDESEVTYSRIAGEGQRVLEISRFTDQARDFWLESWRGVYPLASGLLRDGAPDRSYYSRSVYADPFENAPTPEPGRSWSSELVEVDSRGAELGQTRLTVTFEGERAVTIGGCAYEAIQVETLFADEAGGYQGTLDYLPELGIAIQTAGGDLGGLIDFYLPVSITVAGAERP